ncbi:MAG: hypothetical protein AVDCRST_MAG83-1897 [uncultured Arthrobacter sp.]|uniref:Lipoprotein n=1 Tax=uncultured Arthrobacter sp. TaxID=114050 RepID=A0A6J4IBX1_9MICC|nr:hypothetical protein [uncultured Arthrobacter sp.]CAA9245866.1 MAG: hypothetical protein AVDCRST_MAG83-1897 [uncultured Arthrobacter sp.]
MPSKTYARTVRTAATVAAATGLAVLLAGCGGGEQSYSSLADLRADLEAGGVTCAPFAEADASELIPGASAGASCLVNEAAAAIFIFEDGDTKEIFMNGAAEEIKADPEAGQFLTGPNWIFNADSAELIQSAQEALGGEIIE